MQVTANILIDEHQEFVALISWVNWWLKSQREVALSLGIREGDFVIGLKVLTYSKCKGIDLMI